MKQVFFEIPNFSKSQFLLKILKTIIINLINNLIFGDLDENNKINNSIFGTQTSLQIKKNDSVWKNNYNIKINK